VFDAYAHCGVSKYLPVESVLGVHRAAGISGGILVQHLTEFDNTYLVEAAARAGPLYRAVVLVDESSPGWRHRLHDLSRHPAVAGVRVVARADSERWVDLAAAAAEAGLVVLLYFPAGAGPVRASVDRLARDHEAGRFVLTHLGSPRLGRRLDEDVAALAARQNLFLQVSGFGMWSQPPYSGTDEPVRRLLMAFGPTRLTWGSNFPVCELETELRHALGDPWRLGHAARDALLGQNALRLWGLHRPAA
jgi:predicted TIM-barrel fold metal-dependent hydrolase